MNKRKLSIFIFVLIFIFFLIYVFFFNDNGSIIFFYGTDSSKIINEYEKINDTIIEGEKGYSKVDISNNKFEYTDINEIINIFNNKDSVIIFFLYVFLSLL